MKIERVVDLFADLLLVALVLRVFMARRLARLFESAFVFLNVSNGEVPCEETLSAVYLCEKIEGA